MDSGGKTGIIRSDERDKVIAISDLFRNLTALIPPEANHTEQVQAFIETITYIDGRQRNLGYTIYYALLEKYGGDFAKVQDHLEKLLGVKFVGRAIPVTLEPTNIAFQTASGHQFIGEHELDAQSMSRDEVVNIWLDPPVKATHEAIEAISSADIVIYCPGSIYGSVLANLLPQGMTNALKLTKAKKILITNLVSDRNQTHGYNVSKYLTTFQKYTDNPSPFDTVILPNLTTTAFNKLHPKVAAQYRLEHSYFLGWQAKEKNSLRNLEIELIHTDIFNITSKLNRIRHDPQKLARVFAKVFTKN
jgi:uncharacterized cofD-like protein